MRSREWTSGWTNLVHNYDGKRSDVLPVGWSMVRCNWCGHEITAYPPNLGMLMESHRETCTGEFDDMLYDPEAWERWVLSLRPSNALRACYRSFESELGCGAEPAPEFKRALEARGYDGFEYPPVALMLDDGRILWRMCEQTSNTERAVFRS